MEIELSMNAQADRAVGLDMSNPISAVRQQFFVNKYLDHVKDVLGLAWRLFQRMGPDEVFFQVTGNPNPQTMTKGSPDENYSFSVSFDSLSADPENAESRMKQIGSLVQFDRNGRIDMDKFLEFAAMSIDPPRKPPQRFRNRSQTTWRRSMPVSRCLHSQTAHRSPCKCFRHTHSSLTLPNAHRVTRPSVEGSRSMLNSISSRCSRCRTPRSAKSGLSPLPLVK